MQAKICLSERKETLDNRSLTLGHILIFISKGFSFCTVYSFCISCLQQANSANIIYQSSFIGEQQPWFPDVLWRTNQGGRSHKNKWLMPKLVMYFFKHSGNILKSCKDT